MYIFISYAKKDARNLAELLDKKFDSLNGVTAWMDYELETGEDWAVQIQDEIERCDLMIVIISEDVNRKTKPRSFVLKEIHYAQQNHKPIIPVLAQKTSIPVQLAGIEYIDLTKNQAIGIARLVKIVSKRAGLESPRLTSTKTTPKPNNWLWIAAVGILSFIVVGVIAFLALGNGDDATPETLSSPTSAEVALNPSDTFTPTNTEGVMNNAPTPNIIGTGDEELFEQWNTQLAQTRLAITDTPETPTNTFTHTLTLTHTLSPTPTLTAREQAILLAQQGVISDSDWLPYAEEFDGVLMALVPNGCFMMGEELGGGDSSPLHEQCIHQPFWIDITEVTQVQFETFDGVRRSGNYFYGDNRPVDSITWSEARDYCILRQGRLPTEVEWEYAARGPNNRKYPWGNTYFRDNLVQGANSNSTADVGSRPRGASWVGAMDMSGNVWEWVSSIYKNYPYDGNDGRESISTSNDLRVLRGGSFNSVSLSFDTYARSGDDPNSNNFNYGFRCVRPLE